MLTLSCFSMLDCLKNMKLVAPQTVFGGNWKPCIRNQEPPKHARKIKSYPFQLPRATPMSSKHCSTWLLLLKHRKTIEKPLLKDAEKLPHFTTAIIFAPPPPSSGDKKTPWTAKRFFASLFPPPGSSQWARTCAPVPQSGRTPRRGGAAKRGGVAKHGPNRGAL